MSTREVEDRVTGGDGASRQRAARDRSIDRRVLLASAAGLGFSLMVSPLPKAWAKPRRKKPLLTEKQIRKIEKSNFKDWQGIRERWGFERLVWTDEPREEMLAHCKYVCEHMTMQQVQRLETNPHEGTPIGRKLNLAFGDLTLRGPWHAPEDSCKRHLADMDHRIRDLNGRTVAQSKAARREEGHKQHEGCVALFIGKTFWICASWNNAPYNRTKTMADGFVIVPREKGNAYEHSGGDVRLLAVFPAYLSPPVNIYGLDTSGITDVAVSWHQKRRTERNRLRTICSHRPKDRKYFRDVYFEGYGTVVTIYPMINAGEDYDESFPRRESSDLAPNTQQFVDIEITMEGAEDPLKIEHAFHTGKLHYGD